MARFTERMIPRRGATAAAVAAALFLAGGGVGAGTMYAARPVKAMAPVAIQPISALAADSGPFAADKIASVRGKVTEIYGSRFTLTDASGKALVEAGRRRRDGLVAAGETVTVQGRFGDGVLHAAYLVGADGTVTALDAGPRGGPHGRRGPGGPHGPGGPGGPGNDRAAPPPPAPGDAARPATPPAGGTPAGPDADGPDA